MNPNANGIMNTFTNFSISNRYPLSNPDGFVKSQFCSLRDHLGAFQSVPEMSRRGLFAANHVMYIIKPANNTNDSRQTGRVNAFDFGTAKRRRVSLGKPTGCSKGFSTR